MDVLLLPLCRRIPSFLPLLACNLLYFQKRKKKQRGHKLIIRVKEYECSLCDTFNFFIDLAFSEVKEILGRILYLLIIVTFFLDYQAIFGCKKFSKRFVKSKIFQLLWVRFDIISYKCLNAVINSSFKTVIPTQKPSVWEIL